MKQPLLTVEPQGTRDTLTIEDADADYQCHPIPSLFCDIVFKLQERVAFSFVISVLYRFTNNFSTRILFGIRVERLKGKFKAIAID